MNYILPIIIALIIIVAALRKKNAYADFLQGAEQGIDIILNIFPPLLAITVASSMLRASGAFEMLENFLSPLTQKLGMPPGVLPLAIIRPVSGSGSLAVLTDTLREYGADSETGKIASIIMGSTETTFYCMGVYFSKAGVKNTLRALPCALIGDLCGILAACMVV